MRVFRKYRYRPGTKLLVPALALLLLGGGGAGLLSGSAAFAQTAVTAYGGWPGAAQVAASLGYRDLAGHWAAGMILRAAGLGILPGQGAYFRPQAGLTRREALESLLRALGGAAGGPAAAPAAQAGPAAAVLDAAEQAGLLLRGEREAVAAVLDQGVTRQELAAWLARALGLTAPASPGPRLLSTFADADRVRPDFAPLLEALLQQGLLAGRGRHLAPEAVMTRAEAAALIGRALPALVAARGWEVTEGLVLTREEVRAAQGRVLTFRFRAAGGEEMLLQAGPGAGGPWAADWPVIKAHRAGTSELLVAGDLVRLWLRGNLVVLAEVLPAARRQVSGIIETVVPQEGRLAVSVGGRREEFSLHPAVRVTVGGQSAAPTDLLPGQGVSLVVRGGLVEEVAANPFAADLPAYRLPVTRTFTATLAGREGDRLRVRLADGREETWALAATTAITSGDRTLEPGELRPGDILRLTVEEDGSTARLVRVEVASEYPPETLWYGRLARVQPRDRVVVLAAARRLYYGRWLEPQDYRSFGVSPDASVFLGGRPADLGDLAAVGAGQVFLTVRRGSAGEEAVWILAQEGEAWVYQDELEAIRPARRQVTLAAGTVLDVAAGARLLQAGRAVGLADMEVGAPVQVVAAGGVAVFAERPEYYPPAWSFYSGRVEEVGERTLVLDDWRRYTGQEWSEESDEEKEFEVSGSAVVIDATGAEVRVLDAFTFLESRFTQAFAGRRAFLVDDGEGRVLALALRRSAPGPEVAGLGTVAEVGTERLLLKDVLGWSTGYRGWRALETPLRLDLSSALVFEGRKWIGPAALDVGDLIYVIHDYDRGFVAFRLPR